MTTTTHNTILLQANSESGGRPVFEDKINGAAAAITPGAVLKLSGAGSVVLADSGNPVQRLVAVENPYSDANTTNAINDTYAQNETVRYIRAQPGDIVNCLLSDGQSVTPGVMLVYGTTDGELVAAGTHDATLVTETVFGFSLDTAAPSGSNARIRVMVR